jgi:hypothetical protein
MLLNSCLKKRIVCFYESQNGSALRFSIIKEAPYVFYQDDTGLVKWVGNDFIKRKNSFC